MIVLIIISILLITLGIAVSILTAEEAFKKGGAGNE